MPKIIIDKTEWEEFLRKNTDNLDGQDHYDRGFEDGLGVADMWINMQPMPLITNRDWLGSLTAAEFVGWIKNEAAAMSDAELLKWMEEEYHG